MFGARSIRSNIRKINFGFQSRGKFMLGSFRRLFQALKSQEIFGNINPFLFSVFRRQIINNPFIKIVASEMGIAAGPFNRNRLFNLTCFFIFKFTYF